MMPCPICRQEPEVMRTREGGWLAMCWCKTMYAETKKGLLHQWDDLYCADDLATVEDCE